MSAHLLLGMSVSRVVSCLVTVAGLNSKTKELPAIETGTRICPRVPTSGLLAVPSYFSLHTASNLRVEPSMLHLFPQLVNHVAQQLLVVLGSFMEAAGERRRTRS